ncbi:PqqD family protein [Terrisporobacter mayombei]|uniref:PqqD family protein n=1 Tax=Terrisporobacter mayombei TaxID=1541 RepID=A0ABY9Q754_9FIRM|nr:PqqD family protein [Terrisporobacter mayombei]MCC3869647.1 PqqD family protein [Terrisporobacter mayombei]WMT83414.1 hypothetical protein TEMA_39300 [Terrisporobacter mayombei]
MKIKEGFILRKIAGEDIVVPIGNNIADFNGVIRLNESAAFLWRELQEEISKKDLVNKLKSEYDIGEELAVNDVEDFIKILEENNALEGV